MIVDDVLGKRRLMSFQKKKCAKEDQVRRRNPGTNTENVFLRRYLAPTS